jgi:3-hydroxyisobutyrate dehydrogenase
MNIAWIGLGNMGAPMATNLVKAGQVVAGFDIQEEARSQARANGVTIAASPRAAVEGAEVVFTMLPSGQHVGDIYAEALDAASPDALFVDCSTIDLATARELHDLVAAAGHRFVDAPVSGGVSGASAGTLTFMVGGTLDNFSAARKAIEPMAGRIFHTGGPGAGQSAKIVNNLMLGVNLAGLCEGATLADRLGLDPTTFYELAKVSSGDSWALRTWYPQPGVVETAAVNRDFAGGFSVDLFVKDLGLALGAATDTAIDLTHAAKVLEDLELVSRSGHGARDCTILVRKVDGSLADPSPHQS